MRTLIENIVNSELSMLVERRRAKKTRRRTSRRSRARLTPAQRRERSYRRAFSAGVDENAVQDFINYIVNTMRGCLRKEYSWTLTRTVWGTKRICEFAKTFKVKSKLLPEVKKKCIGFATTMDNYTKAIHDNPEQYAKSGYGFNEADVKTRITYMQNYLDKAIKYGKANNNGWDEIAKELRNIPIRFLTES